MSITRNTKDTRRVSWIIGNFRFLRRPSNSNDSASRLFLAFLPHNEPARTVARRHVIQKPTETRRTPRPDPCRKWRPPVTQVHRTISHRAHRKHLFCSSRVFLPSIPDLYFKKDEHLIRKKKRKEERKLEFMIKKTFERTFDKKKKGRKEIGI